MNLIDPADLPKSAADGPDTWGSAVSTVAVTNSTSQQFIENTTSDRSMLSDIYARRIAKIEQVTGQTLENPISSEIMAPAFLQPPFRAAYTQNEQAFDKRVSDLQTQFPALADAFPETPDDEMNRMRRDAEAAAAKAAQNPYLDPISRFVAQMAGGLAGAARDSFQWQMAIAGGGGGSAGSSVAGKIGKTMLSEAMLNGGQEAVLQIASQPRKKAAGLEYGLNDALSNIGVAATFGALFGGTMEAGHALAGIYRMGDGGAEVATRVLEGKPQPGDVETMAKAMGVELQPEQLQQLNRSFEERVLDDHMIGADATPEQQRVFEAAKRYAEDPDNNPPPEIVERAIADEQAGPARTLTADDYERIYGGDPDAIDDLRGVMQAESLDDAARMIDDQTRAPVSGQGESVNAEPAFEVTNTGQLSEPEEGDLEKWIEQEIRTKSALSPQEQGRIDKSYSEGLGDDGVADLVAKGAVPAPRDIVVYRGETGNFAASGPSEFLSTTFSKRTGDNFANGVMGERGSKGAARYVVKKGTPVYSPRSEIRGGELLVRRSDLVVDRPNTGLLSLDEARKARSTAQASFDATDEISRAFSDEHQEIARGVADAHRRRASAANEPPRDPNTLEILQTKKRDVGKAHAGIKLAKRDGRSVGAVTLEVQGSRATKAGTMIGGISDEPIEVRAVHVSAGENQRIVAERLLRGVEADFPGRPIRFKSDPSMTVDEFLSREFPAAREDAATIVEDKGDTVMLKSREGDANLSVRRDGENLKVGITSVSKASRGQGKARQLYEEAVRLADENGGVLRSDISVSNDALRVYNSLSRRGYDVRRNPDAVRQKNGWIAPDRPGENWVFEVRPRPDPTAVVDPLEGQTIRPRSAPEPSDAEAMRIAEEQAGAIAEPVIDANGNPRSLFDYVPIVDRDGNVRLVSTNEALEIADQGNILADLLEVCQV